METIVAQTVVASRGYEIAHTPEGVTMTVPETRDAVRNRRFLTVAIPGLFPTWLTWVFTSPWAPGAPLLTFVVGCLFVGIPLAFWLTRVVMSPGPFVIELTSDSLIVRDKRYLKRDLREIYAQGPGEVFVTGRNAMELNSKAQMARAGLAKRWAEVAVYGGERIVLSNYLTEFLATDLVGQIESWRQTPQRQAVS